MARPENELPTDIPMTLRSLAHDMRTLRKDSKLTIKELSKVSNYSTAALSSATSGKTLPSWDLVQAFVLGCGYDEDDMERWKRAWRAARRDMKGTSSTSSSEDTGDHPVPLLHNLVPPKLRRSSEPTPAPPAPAPPRPQGLLALVESARMHERRDKRVSSVTTGDYVHTALALCTRPEDVIEVMNELVIEKGLSIQELEQRSKEHFPISDTTFTQVLNGSQLPTTEWMYIFLSACGLEEKDTVMWHFTVTRIRIAQMRLAQKEAYERSRRRRRELRNLINRVFDGSELVQIKVAYVALAVTSVALFVQVMSKGIKVPLPW